jgi:hypothetical protein
MNAGDTAGRRNDDRDTGVARYRENGTLSVCVCVGLAEGVCVCVCVCVCVKRMLPSDARATVPYGLLIFGYTFRGSWPVGKKLMNLIKN